MGERALAVCRCLGEDWAYRAQWGGTPERRGAVLSGGWDSVDRLLRCEWYNQGQTRLSRVLETLDHLSIQAVYVLSSGAVRLLVPVWFGVPGLAGAATVPSWVGGVVRPSDRANLSRLTGRLKWLRRELGRAIDDGSISELVAGWFLWQSLAPFQHSVTPAARRYISEWIPRL